MTYAPEHSTISVVFDDTADGKPRRESGTDRTLRKFRKVRFQGTHEVDTCDLDQRGRISKSEADTHAETQYEEFASRRRAFLEAEAERQINQSIEEAAKNLPEPPTRKRRKK